jgi:hypothetical protein
LAWHRARTPQPASPPGKISREGDEDLRRLLVLAAAAVIQQAKPGRASRRLLGLLAAVYPLVS